MAKPLQNLSVAAPAFFGLNTQDSPVGMSANFANVADNCVIDKQGRIGARKGYNLVTANGAATLGSSDGIEHIQEFVAYDGTKTIFSMGNLKIFRGTTTLVELAFPTGYSCTANNWKTASFTNNLYFFQAGHAPLKYVSGSNALVLVPDSGSTPPPQGDELLAGFGRLWVTSVLNQDYNIYFSASLNGDNWHASDTGVIDVTKVWPNGYDSIVALAEHNGFLVVFGKRSIILYSGAALGPAEPTFVLHDTIEGIGCIARDSVQSTGNDLLFLSNRGVMSLGRLIQEKSLPLRDISKNVRTELIDLVQTEFAGGNGHNLRSVYSAREAFYLLTFPTSDIVYCFDVRTPLEDGSFRATTWSALNPIALAVLADDTLYMGIKRTEATEETGIVEYQGYLDGSETYEMRYVSHPLDFGNSTNLKFLKKFNVTIIGGSGALATLGWAYNYSENYTKQALIFPFSGTTGYFGLGKFNISEYSGGVTVNEPKVNTTGSGTEVSVSLETTVNNFPFSIQKIDIHATLGRFI